MIKTLTAAACAASLMLSPLMATPVYAKTSFQSAFSISSGYSNNYGTVYTNGEDAWVQVKVKGDNPVDIELWDENGHRVYMEREAVGGNSSRWFYLGKDHSTYKIYCPPSYIGSSKVTLTKSKDCKKMVLK